MSCLFRLFFPQHLLEDGKKYWSKHVWNLLHIYIYIINSHILYVLTYVLTTWSRALLENLTGLQLVKKFPAFYVTRRFITAFTSARHQSLSWSSSIQSIPPNPTSWKNPSKYYPPIYAWVSPVVSFPRVSPPKPCTCWICSRIEISSLFLKYLKCLKFQSYCHSALCQGLLKLRIS